MSGGYCTSDAFLKTCF